MHSKVIGHWTDDQLIAHLYGVGPEDGHLRACSRCQERLSAMEGERAAIERSTPGRAEVNSAFLAAQRREIYARMTQPERWWSGTSLQRWASAAATLLVLGGGLVVYEQHQGQGALNNKVNDKISDAQLAAQVSSMTQESEPSSTAPLQALFQE